MSLAKVVPKGIKDKECGRFALRERPPVPYVLEMDPVQETVSALKSDQSLKTTIGEDAELHIPIWHTGTRKAFLMHVSTATALDIIKKHGTFKAYKEACRKPPRYVPYKCTYVLYNGTFGTSDQGQTLDV
jgi:hypothetical protein